MSDLTRELRHFANAWCVLGNADLFTDAAGEIDRLREENARLRENAERYRYLASLMRGEPELMGDAYGFRWVLPDGILSERMMLRDAIDAAMREAK